MSKHPNKYKKTPLYNLHHEQGGKMGIFAGYRLPIQYVSGVKNEHLHTRSHAGLFDVSHMTQISLIGPNAATDLEKIAPVDIINLAEGRQRYVLFTNENGGIIDDIMVTRLPSNNRYDNLYIVANAACIDQDITHLQTCLSDNTVMEVLDDRALIALQGPESCKVLNRLAIETNNMVFLDVCQIMINKSQCYISRSGYTGEDGFEISIPGIQATQLVQDLLEQPEVEMIGLGARDSLRLEAGLCLYGNDININTTPVEGSLAWTINNARRTNGSRAGGFPGANIILPQINNLDITSKRVGLIGTSKAPVREGAEIVSSNDQKIGYVTSGTFSPSINAPIAMAYVAKDFIQLGTEVFALVRGKKLAMTISRMPFVESQYFRG